MSQNRDKREPKKARSQNSMEIDMNLDLDLSSTNEVYQPQLPRLQRIAEDTHSTFLRFSDVLNTVSDGHTDKSHPRKRSGIKCSYVLVLTGIYPLTFRNKIRLMLGGKKTTEESTLLGSVGPGATELSKTSSNINYSAKGMGPPNGPSNDDFYFILKSTGSILGSPKPINICKEEDCIYFEKEEDYIASINSVQDYLNKIKNIVECGGSHDVLKAAVSAMEHVTDMLTSMSTSSSPSLSRL